MAVARGAGVLREPQAWLLVVHGKGDQEEKSALRERGCRTAGDCLAEETPLSLSGGGMESVGAAGTVGSYGSLSLMVSPFL